MSDEHGLSAYRHAAPSRAVIVFAALKRKVELRAALEVETARIFAALPTLTESEFGELRALMETFDADVDADVAALQTEAARLAREAAAARTIKPLAVPISKTASRILAHEIERRLSRGHCPDLAMLAEQAIRQCYGE